MATIPIRQNAGLYLRDPESSPLGRKIIQASIALIDSYGIDGFTFKKLSNRIGSSEASVYRYFENKHRLLQYLMHWYWSSLEYRIEYTNHHISDPIDRLKNAIRLIVDQKAHSPDDPFVDQEKLQRIVNSEFEKTYLTHQVDADNKEGMFLPYNSLCNRIADIIKEVNPDYAYPHTLISTVLLSATHQLYYAEHLPSLTDIKAGSKQKYTEIARFLETLLFNTINPKVR